MDSRYSHPQIAALRHPQAQYTRWAQVEREVAAAQAHEGLIPEEAATAICDTRAPTPHEVEHFERETRHDVAAFLIAFGNLVGVEHKRWIHYGLTSSDLVDTANARSLYYADRTLLAGVRNLGAQLRAHTDAWYPNLIRLGRTHGQPAEPIPFSRQLERLWAGLLRGRAYLTRSQVPMKLSGPVGTYAYNPPAVEARVAGALALSVDAYSSQVVGRECYAAHAAAVLSLATACEQIGWFIRSGARDGELSEAFDRGQVGSSSMPHKRNPVRAERLCGLARVARGYLMPILETAGALLDERDISNSSVERVALWDLIELTAWMLDEAADLIAGMKVHERQIADNLRGLALPTPAARLWMSVQLGSDREEAHRYISNGGDGAMGAHINIPEVWEAYNAAMEPAWYARHLPGSQERGYDDHRGN